MYYSVASSDPSDGFLFSVCNRFLFSIHISSPHFVTVFILNPKPLYYLRFQYTALTHAHSAQRSNVKTAAAGDFVVLGGMGMQDTRFVVVVMMNATAVVTMMVMIW